MDWKAFFKPERSKIILTLIITAVLAISGFVILTLPKECSDNSAACKIPPLGTLLLPFYIVPLLLFVALPLATQNTLLFYVLLAISLVASVFYWYFLACIAVYVFRKIKKLGKL